MLTEATIKTAEAILLIMGRTLSRHPSGDTVTIDMGRYSLTMRTDKALMNAVAEVVSGLHA